jgi:hypothetical protein
MNISTGDGGTCNGDPVARTSWATPWSQPRSPATSGCKASDKTYRVDTQVARDFLDDFRGTSLTFRLPGPSAGQAAHLLAARA